MRPRTVVSARAVLYINGSPFGRVTDFKWNVLQGIKENRGIDSVDPYELAVTASRVMFTMSVIKTGSDGGAEGAGMSAPFQDLPNQKYFSVMLVDRLTDTVMFQSDANMVVSQNWSVPVKGVVTGVIQAQGILWNNEVRALHQ